MLFCDLGLVETILLALRIKINGPRMIGVEKEGRTSENPYAPPESDSQEGVKRGRPVPCSFRVGSALSCRDCGNDTAPALEISFYQLWSCREGIQKTEAFRHGRMGDDWGCARIHCSHSF